MKNRISCLVFLILVLFAGTTSAQDPLNHLRDETLSYFKPLKGRVLSVDGNTVTADMGEMTGIKRGMRFSILKEGIAFLHPVTKEPIGRIEAPVGKAVVRGINPDSSIMEVIKGNASVGDILRTSGMKIRVLFYQDRTVDWNLGESYYRLLKDSGRFELLDTSLDSGDDSIVMAEAKRLNAEVALILRAGESGKETPLRQRLIWVEDSSMLAETETKVDIAYLKELRFAEGTAALQSSGDVVLFFDLPFSARLIATGDVDGDGKQELIISTGRDIRVCVMGVSLQTLYEIKGAAGDDHLWMDAIDINSDGRDEIIVTSMKDDEVVSYIYGLKGSEFSLLYKDNLFLRRLNNGLIAQKYDRAEGFDGPVFNLTYQSGEFKRGSTVKLPQGVNIYDFAEMDSSSGERYILAYDDAGYLNLYNAGGLRVWRSSEGYGGFLTAFKKAAPTIMVDRGEWTVKDRIFLKNRESVVAKRIPLANMAKGIGYKSSQIRVLWWTGLSMEERTLIDNISGGIQDYALVGDRLIVISKPLFGIKPKNILKGENPLGSMLYVYSLKGI
ncbi:MAG: VCBS repeat-containing protein [Thermodesulfovibrionales bacterium]